MARKSTSEPETPIAPDPEASNIEAAANAAKVAEMVDREPTITSGFGVFTFDPNAKISMMYQGVYYDMEAAEMAAMGISKDKDALNVIIPISYFC